MSDEMLAWLSVWSEEQMFCTGPANTTATSPSLASLKSRLACRLTHVVKLVVEKRPLNGCLSLQSRLLSLPVSSILALSAPTRL